MLRAVALVVVAGFVATTTALVVVDVAMHWGALLSSHVLESATQSLSVAGGDTGKRAAAAVIEVMKKLVVMTSSGREALSQRTMSWPVVVQICTWRCAILWVGRRVKHPGIPGVSRRLPARLALSAWGSGLRVPLARRHAKEAIVTWLR